MVKVEPPRRGEPGRHTEPGGADSIYFLSYNANKHSLTLDLSTEDGRRLFLQLLSRFDVVTENFPLSTMDRLGLGYETLRAVHPPLIYATIKGFGLEGPYAAYKCYDQVAEAAGGGDELDGTPASRSGNGREILCRDAAIGSSRRPTSIPAPRVVQTTT